MASKRTTHHNGVTVMYELTLAHLNGAERERDLEADLRQRQVLKASDAVRRAVTADLANTADAALALRPHPTPARVRSVGR